jgi:hypothetical protein
VSVGFAAQNCAFSGDACVRVCVCVCVCVVCAPPLPSDPRAPPPGARAGAPPSRCSPIGAVGTRHATSENAKRKTQNAKVTARRRDAQRTTPHAHAATRLRLRQPRGHCSRAEDVCVTDGLLSRNAPRHAHDAVNNRRRLRNQRLAPPAPRQGRVSAQRGGVGGRRGGARGVQRRAWARACALWPGRCRAVACARARARVRHACDATRSACRAATRPRPAPLARSAPRPPHPHPRNTKPQWKPQHKKTARARSMPTRHEE